MPCADCSKTASSKKLLAILWPQHGDGKEGSREHSQALNDSCYLPKVCMPISVRQAHNLLDSDAGY